MKNSFCSADILLPKADLGKWAVVACDQFTSQPEYWDRVAETVGDAPSTLRMILPEAQLHSATDEVIAGINRTMEDYLASDLFTTWPNSYVYLERRFDDGRVRRGLIGAVDLEAYDWHAGSQTPIRATEGTVAERLPPRIRVRKGAPVELPHILLLANDPQDTILSALTENKEALPQLYDFELMEKGGHITGWLVAGEAAAALDARLTAYESAVSLPYAVGDGNHSLATAKACWDAIRETVAPDHPARYALVELENIHEPALEFEPIHRVITGVDPETMLSALQAWTAPDGYPVQWVSANGSGTLSLARKSALAVGVLQAFLDQYGQGEVDYIHGDDVLRNLAQQPDSIGFLLPPMAKSDLFTGVEADGALPRKTFSMGHAHEKRYYLEGRVIR